MSARHRIAYPLAVAALLALAPVAAHAQIPNAGFETWASGNASGWATNNSAPVLVPVTQSLTAHSGTSAVKGAVVSYFTAVFAPLLQAGPMGRGFAWATRSGSFTGWYEFSPVGGDRFVINTILFKGGINGTGVGVAASTISTAASSWTQFNVPFIYQTADTPDTCIVQFQIIGPTGVDYHSGSYFLIDDLAFGTGSTGVDGPPAKPLSTGFLAGAPNPFTNGTTVSFALAERGPVTLAVYDMQGRAVATLMDTVLEPGQYAAAWNSKQAPSGVYWARLTAGATTLSRKLVRMR